MFKNSCSKLLSDGMRFIGHEHYIRGRMQMHDGNYTLCALKNYTSNIRPGSHIFYVSLSELKAVLRSANGVDNENRASKYSICHRQCSDCF